MHMPFNSRFYRYSVGTILILTIVYLLGKVSYLLTPFKVILNALFISIIVGLLLYYIFRPLVRVLANKKHININIAILTVFLFLGLILTIVAVYGGATIKEQFTSFFSNIPSQLRSARQGTGGIIENKFTNYISIANIEQKLIETSEKLFKSILVNTGGVISAIANIGSQIILIPFVLFYLLKDDKKFFKSFLEIVPRDYRNNVKILLKDVDETLSIYITGQLIVSLVIGILMYIGYKIIGISNPLVLATISMVTSIIPMLGTFIGILPAIFVALTMGLPMVVKVLIVLTVVQQLEGNFVSPYVIGNRLKIHPLAVVFVIIISISLFGFVGGFLAIPTYAVLKVLVKDIIKIYK
ncbi:AI-2E family transporter [Clostridium bovifaecis]|uniref:AI-2E family transporter n=1 Tax=Clostridium bovifaecis TaxID=2184719 RepID=A0A6I6F2X5_9CLOT|nr:AI-2E family transporter [Clostridium bovifaecis]